jgi:hypothetical protein
MPLNEEGTHHKVIVRGKFVGLCLPHDQVDTRHLHLHVEEDTGSSFYPIRW